MHKHLVLVVRPSETIDPSVVRVACRGLQALSESIGLEALLVAPREEAEAGYFAVATIYDWQVADKAHAVIWLENIRYFKSPVPVLVDGKAWEPALENANGDAVFGRFAFGVRGIPSIAFAAVILAAELYPSEPLPEMNRQHTVSEIDEAAPSPDPLDPGTSYGDAANLSIRIELQFRRQRARLRAQLTRSSGAFCVMSGASFDLPGGGSLLEVSHYHPLFQQGPDTINNVGLKTRNVHAIYENGLVTIRQDHRIRFAPDIPPGFRAEFRGRTHAAIPEIVNLSNLRFHEKEIFERRLRRLGISVSD